MGDSELLSRVWAALAPVSNVKEQRMFGSTACMVRGKLCISARAERIMCRIDPTAAHRSLEVFIGDWRAESPCNHEWMRIDHKLSPGHKRTPRS